MVVFRVFQRYDEWIPVTSHRIQPINSKVGMDDSYTEMATRGGEGEGDEEGDESGASVEGAALDDFSAAAHTGGGGDGADGGSSGGCDGGGGDGTSELVFR